MSRVDNALLLRDTIQKIVNDKIGKTNPGSSYATVTGFNPALGIITVRYPGDDVDIEIPAGSIYPSKPGQIVRVEGPTGSRVVADVKGENLTEVKARTAQETADGKNTVNYGETPPEGTDHKDGDIWFDESNSNMPHVWNGTEWKSIEDLRVSAIKAAQDELKADLDTIVENGVGTKSFYKPTEPTAAESKEGDLWFDTSESGNNELHTYVNGAWVSAADARIAAIQQAQAELASDLEDVVANGIGTRTHYTPTQPTVADSKDGDLWFDPSDNNKPYIFQGGGWVTVRDSYVAPGAIETINLVDKAITTAKIAVGAITAESGIVGSLDAGKITVGTLDAARIAANSITADKVLLGGDRNMLPNGEVRTGDLSGWPSTLKVSTDAPDGYPFSVTNENNLTMSADLSSHGSFPVSPGDVLVLDLWVKADKPDSRLYIEVRSSGVMVADSSYRWEPVEGTGPASSYLYPVANYIVPTTWTHLVQRVKIRPGVKDVYLSRVYFNHANGAERGAIQSIAGMKLYKAVGSTLIEPGAITTEKIAVGAITAESGVVASLDAGKITVGALDSARIAANSITADKMLIGSGANMIDDPTFEYGANGWKLSSMAQIVSVSDGPAGGVANVARLSITNNDNSPLIPLSFPMIFDSTPGAFALNPGDNYRFVFKARVVSRPESGTGYLRMRGLLLTADKSSRSWPVLTDNLSTSAPLGEWREITGNWGYSGGSYTTLGVSVHSSNASGAVFEVAFVGMYPTVGSTLIEPGAITTEKLATGAITAESGVIGSLDASKITVGKLSGARLEADAINGMQIIGATIATSTGFPRVQLDTAGIAVYKSSSVRSFFADAKTGNLDLVGNLATATSGNERVVLDNALWNSIEVVDEEGNLAGSVAGSGISVGIGGQATLDLFHAGRSIASSGSYVDSGSIMGPRPTGQTRGAILSLSRTIRTDKSEFNWASLDVGKANGYYTARVGVTDADGSAFINANGPVRVTSGSNFSVVSSRDVLIQSSRDVSLSPGGNYGQLKLTAVSDDGARRTQQSVSPSGVFSNIYNSTWRHEVVAYPQQWSTQFIKSGSNSFDNGMSMTPEHFTVLSGGASLRINNVPTSATTWSTDFGRNLTPWGYIGSPSGVGADDFGIQSAAGKRLVLNAGTGSAKITLGTDGSITGLPMAGGRGSTGTMVANTPKAVAVTFPSGRFTGTPNVSLTISSTVPGKTVTGCGVAGISKTGFTAYITRTNTTSTSFEWTAIEAN